MVEPTACSPGKHPCDGAGEPVSPTGAVRIAGRYSQENHVRLLRVRGHKFPKRFWHRQGGQYPGERRCRKLLLRLVGEWPYCYRISS